MLGLLLTLGFLGAVALALYSVVRGSDSKVTESDIGGVNAFDSYYGKNAHRYGGETPCEECGKEGCIGLGLCRCRCHQK
ncbi:MAG: hypothetical protein HYZ28_20480 [Myxococcales bacterium]|nr:hypothetical protein [Myxococcales bacterium]